ASAVTPGLAKRLQKGTEPSAKSSHSGVLVNREQFASSCCAGAPFPPASASARTAATRTPSLFTRLTVAASSESLRAAYKRFTVRHTATDIHATRPGFARPRYQTLYLLRFLVEGGVHFRDLLRLDIALAGAAAVLDVRLVRAGAEGAGIEPERVEVDAV